MDTPRQWLEVKAIKGDISDEIGGVGGIGDKGAIELINTYGSVNTFNNSALEGTLKDAPKKFRDFAEQTEKQDIFARNMNLMDLNSPNIPKPENLTITKGELNLAQFEKFCRALCFQSMLTDLKGWCEPFETPLEVAHV